MSVVMPIIIIYIYLLKLFISDFWNELNPPLSEHCRFRNQVCYCATTINRTLIIIKHNFVINNYYGNINFIDFTLGLKI